MQFDLATILDLVLIAFFGLNAWFTLQVRKEILNLKIFIYQNFVSRSDLAFFRESENRVAKRV